MTDTDDDSFMIDGESIWPDYPPDYTRSGITLKLGCGACPEQYEAFTADGRLVGYLRLRHGAFRVECPDVGGTVVLKGHPEGDGAFTLEERQEWLDRSIDAILKWMEKQ
jgi:hypothetical protein